MEDPSWPFWLYLVAIPVLAVVLFFVLRWAFGRFPGRVRRELADLQLRVRTLEDVIEHLTRPEEK